MRFTVFFSYLATIGYAVAANFSNPLRNFNGGDPDIVCEFQRLYVRQRMLLC